MAEDGEPPKAAWFAGACVSHCNWSLTVNGCRYVPAEERELLWVAVTWDTEDTMLDSEHVYKDLVNRRTHLSVSV